MTLPNEMFVIICEEFLLLPGRIKLVRNDRLAYFKYHKQLCTSKHPDRWHNGPGYTTCTDRFSGQITNVFAPPTVLDALLVNKQFHDIARSMFVGKNHFEFEGFYGLHRYTTECPTRLPCFCELTISFESPLSGFSRGWSEILQQFTIWRRYIFFSTAVTTKSSIPDQRHSRQHEECEISCDFEVSSGWKS